MCARTSVCVCVCVHAVLFYTNYMSVLNRISSVYAVCSSLKTPVGRVRVVIVGASCLEEAITQVVAVLRSLEVNTL